MRLLFIHGIAQYGKSEEILKEEWLSALKEGAATAGVEINPQSLAVEVLQPFYGDFLFGYAQGRKQRTA